jgi:pseudouridine synthase
MSAECQNPSREAGYPLSDADSGVCLAEEQAGSPMMVVHQTAVANGSASRESSDSTATTHPVLSPLAPGDSGLQLMCDNPAWLSRAAPVLRALPVTYQVRLGRAADTALASRLKRGVTDYGEFLAATEARLVDSGRPCSWMEVTLNHGKSTTVRRLFTAFGIPVREVRRIGVGPIQLGALPSNEHRNLTQEESASLSGMWGD